MNSKRDNTLKPPPEKPNSSNIRKSSSPKRPAGNSDEPTDNKRLRREGASERASQAPAASRAVPSSSRQPSTSGFQEYDVSDEEPTGPTASKGIKANQRPAEHERNPGSTVSHDDKKLETLVRNINNWIRDHEENFRKNVLFEFSRADFEAAMGNPVEFNRTEVGKRFFERLNTWLKWEKDEKHVSVIGASQQGRRQCTREETKAIDKVYRTHPNPFKDQETLHKLALQLNLPVCRVIQELRIRTNAERKAAEADQRKADDLKRKEEAELERRKEADLQRREEAVKLREEAVKRREEVVKRKEEELQQKEEELQQKEEELRRQGN